MNYHQYYERKQHGSSDFPIQYYYVSAGHPQYSMHPHLHRQFEIIRVQRGRFCADIGGTACNMRSGDIAIAECGVVHRGEPTDCIYECAVFDVSMLRIGQGSAVDTFIAPIINRSVSVQHYYPAGSDGTMSELVGRLFDELRSEREYSQLKIYSVLFGLFGWLYSQGYIVARTSAHNSKQVKVLMRLLDYIEAEYAQPITLHDLAEVAGMSEKYLCQFFKNYTSRTPIDYINHMRIEAACRKLSAGGSAVTDVALECGFNDLSYFSKIFKRYKGVTPREYAKAAPTVK